MNNLNKVQCLIKNKIIIKLLSRKDLKEKAWLTNQI
jgi:hypothetical protein